MNRVVYCFWFGPEMSSDRSRCFQSIKDNSKVEVELVTEANLQQYNLTEHPIHSSFQYLSATHKADYLRPYFMYHYGGGYTDIKYCDYDWNPYFDLLESSDKQFIGYPELSPLDIAYTPAQHLYQKLIGNCSYIFKPQTDFAKLWLEETNKKLDSVSEQLQLYPGHYHPRAIKGGIQGLNENGSSKYPLEWNELLGRIFHRLQADHLNCFSIGMPRINATNYR